MKVYSVTLLGKVFIVEADSDYEARRKAAEEYRKIEKVTKPLVYLRSKCSIRVSEKFDKRVKYPINIKEG